MKILTTKTPFGEPITSQEELCSQLQEIKLALWELWLQSSDMLQQICAHDFAVEDSIGNTICTQCAFACHHRDETGPICNICGKELTK